MSNWMPIETAPRDGTHVLLYGPYEWFEVSEYAPIGIVVGYAEESPQGHYWKLVNNNPYEDVCEPTHWMPLPELPKRDAHDEAK